MKKHLFYLLITALLTSALVEAQSQRGVRIGYIDMEYILESVPEYQEATIQLEGKVQRWKKDIENQQKDIDQMKLNLSNERMLLTKELIEEREEDIKIKEDQLFQYQQDRFGPKGDLIIQKRQLVQPVQDQVFAAVQEIASNRQYDFIFDKSADVVMLYAAERNDISDQVIRIINRAAKRTQAETKQDKKAIETRDGLSDEQDKRLTEREKLIEDKKKEREDILEERRRVRDSIKDAKQKEFTERRENILNNRNQNTENQNTTSGEEGQGTNSSSTSGKSREQILEERKRSQDSIRDARKQEMEARKNKILEDRQKRQDSILNAKNKNTPPVNAGEDGEEDGN